MYSSRPMARVHLAFMLLHEDMHLLQDGWTALMVASVTGNVECVELLLDRGLQVNVQKKVSSVSLYDLFTLPGTEKM